MERKELWIIGGILLFVFLFNQWDYSGRAFSVTERYEDRSAYYRERNPYFSGWLSEGVPVRQDASMAEYRIVGRISPYEHRSQRYPQMVSVVGQPCFSQDGKEGTFVLGEANRVYCDVPP